MTRNEKQDVNRRVKRHSLFLRADWLVKLLLVLIYIAGAILVWNSRDALRTAGENDMVSPIMKMALDNCMEAYLLLGGAVLVVLAVYPFDKKFAQDQLQSIGLVNHTGAVPVLIRKHRDPDNHRVTIWEFRSLSIPLVAWENKRPDIEAALDIHNFVQSRINPRLTEHDSTKNAKVDNALNEKDPDKKKVLMEIYTYAIGKKQNELLKNKKFGI